MLCRRCGMDSAATDICEWCKKPMLPTGGAISPRAAAEVTQADPESPPPGDAVEAGPPAEQMFGATEPEGQMLGTAEEEVADESTQEGPAGAPASEHVLRPLGALGGEATKPPTVPPTASAEQEAGPSHGLEADATRTSVDLSGYMGQDESIFRPIERESDEPGAEGGQDYLAARKKVQAEEREAGSEISENVRLARAMVAGMIISVVVSLMQLAVTRQIPGILNLIAWPIPLGESDTLFTALKYGIVTGLFFDLSIREVDEQ